MVLLGGVFTSALWILPRFDHPAIYHATASVALNSQPQRALFLMEGHTGAAAAGKVRWRRSGHFGRR